MRGGDMRANVALSMFAVVLVVAAVLAVPTHPPREERRAAEVIEVNVELLRDVNKVLREALLTTAIASE
jgi:hypothetical protein